MITNIQLEEGSVATPFEQRPYGLEMSLCQRYYEVLPLNDYPWAYVAFDANTVCSMNFKTVKRTTPSITTLDHNGTVGVVSCRKNNAGATVTGNLAHGGATRLSTYGGAITGAYASMGFNNIAMVFSARISAEL